MESDACCTKIWSNHWLKEQTEKVQRCICVWRLQIKLSNLPVLNVCAGQEMDLNEVGLIKVLILLLSFRPSRYLRLSRYRTGSCNYCGTADQWKLVSFDVLPKYQSMRCERINLWDVKEFASHRLHDLEIRPDSSSRSVCHSECQDTVKGFFLVRSTQRIQNKSI